MFAKTVDLTNCDREPIHIPGSIQPHGVLLLLRVPELEIVQVSNNAPALLGYPPQDLLGKPLTHLFDEAQIRQIRQCLQQDFECMNPLRLSIASADQLLCFDGIVHPVDSTINAGVLLELEPKTSEHEIDFFEFYHQVRGSIIRIQKAVTLQEMCYAVVNEVRKITGFDRVMVYRFDEEGAGSVIAEDTDLVTPYLHLRYPASDIPKQARQLYTQSWLRIIPDANYQPVGLTPQNNPLNGQPLDLSLAVLRSVSPLHLEYLQNMGVTASMSISLVQNQKLWGLIACHHESPRRIPYGLRTACEFIGQVMSLELTHKEANEDLDYQMKLKVSQTRFVEALSQSHYFLDGIVQLETNLLELVGATGAAVCSGDQCILMGETPSQDEVKMLLEWIKPKLHHSLFATRSLCHLYPEAESFRAVASGVLALEISKVHHNYILWFRHEVLQTVNWGGNPNKPVEVLVNGEIRLSPRKSFALWQETVQGYALPWKACEIEAIAELRSLIVGIVLRQADELALMNAELQRSNEELDAFAYIASHDLKEPLRGIHNYANFLMEDYSETLNEDGVAKLQTLVRLTQRMEDLINSLLHFSRLGRAELLRQNVNLNDLVQQAIATLTISRPNDPIDFRIPRPLPTVMCDRAQVNEVFTNLISNAIKYNNNPEKWVEIGFLGNGFRDRTPADKETLPPLPDPNPQLLTPILPNLQPPTSNPQPPIFYIRDNGIGIRKEHHEKIFQIFRRLHGRDEFGGGNGAGLTIARKIVERHGGKIWVESALGEGSTFYFTLASEVPLV